MMIRTLLKVWTLLGVSVALLSACKNDMTYAELRDKEVKQINAFLKTGCTVKDAEKVFDLLKVEGNINVISEAQFYANDSTTDVEKNEYVLFDGSGVYMQILRKGTGDVIAEGETATVACRFTEFNIATDSISKMNTTLRYAQWPDLMSVTNKGTYSATFLSGLMRTVHGSSVPSGWLIPLPFIKIGRQSSENEEIAKVRLIVPSTEGQKDAYQRVYPCFYEITYQQGR